jgi:hypothetical protein
MKKKKFDCVEMMHRGGRKIYEETKNLTFEEEVEYWRKKSDEAVRRHQARIKAAKSRPAA